jgi:glyoxylase-like metal-dependent hydrolase (beta-lactamase superfamily II)
LNIESSPPPAHLPRVNLEDHLGDILRKARAMADVSAATAARAAGISEAELAALEASGQFSQRPNFAALAPALGLHTQKLAALADGWTPTLKNLSAWRELRVLASADERLAVNCYLVWDEATSEAALFDTGFDAPQILALLAAEQLTLRHIFITHSHYDHIHALGDVRAAFPLARVHTSSKNAPVSQRNKPAEITHVGGLRVTYRETPGHAEDGVTYLVGNWQDDAPHVAVVGDAIFAGSIGSGKQSWELARQKVREQILTLPTETLLCPGHGPLTTVGEELAHNPFF